MKSSFQITFSKPNDKRLFRATVEITHRTSHVLKFKIKASTKELSMERYLFRKGDLWKVTGKNFEMFPGDRKSQALIENIQKAIDHELKKATG